MLKLILTACFILPFLNFAQASSESLTLTTYYPSPYGVYRELRSKRMALGDNYYDSNYGWGAGPANQFNANADLMVQGNIGVGFTTVSNMRSDVPLQISGPIMIGNTGLTCTTAADEGLIRYNNAAGVKKLEYCNGSSWSSLTGGAFWQGSCSAIYNTSIGIFICTATSPATCTAVNCNPTTTPGCEISLCSCSSGYTPVTYRTVAGGWSTPDLFNTCMSN